ncbi:phosphatase PAP2 family protein [Streptomyces auratus]|uniref:PA-phosphatase-like phosphoesterase n=1 Tax=Streptomyces auratus AGR0001 TaxID=1160718 RepID=J2JU94_9ACTN|nr:phosphatase PAP2 family protein [Streptomyces auratus]QTZ90063.1 phosphatase PAP2 family protein [Streptomyces auratus AGR0001]
MNSPRRLKWQYPVIAVVAAGAVGFGLMHASASPAASGAAAKKKPGATELIKSDPPPTLFTDAQVAGLAKQQAAQKHTADALFAKWKAAHGSTRDDKAFSAWAAQQVPAPPGKADRTAELHQVQTLAKSRTAAGKKAATWLETHGKGDIWKLYAHDQRELLPKEQGSVEKAELKTALKLAKAITEKVAARDKQPAPYVLDPSLRPDKHLTAGQKGPYSYPSRHAAKAAAAVTLLGDWSPHRAEDYKAMAAQVVYSRLYMAGHVPSDLTAGTLVGDLVGDYFRNAAATSAASK